MLLPSILVFGRDPLLLETRRLVLEQAGFHVLSVADSAGVEKIVLAQPISLLVLCHSITDEERESVLKSAHSRRPDMKNIVLTTGTSVSRPGKNYEFVNAYDGPRSLISTVERLLKNA
jgi:DNA-binding NtrC family response regulator